MQRILILISSLACFLLLSCSAPKQPLQVKTFVLRDQERDTGTDPWARMEKQALLHGAITMEERKARLGQYFTVLWNEDSKIKEPVRITFQYLQGGSASKVKEMSQDGGTFQTSGRATFAIIGDDYTTNGRVLAWQVRLFRGDQEVASRRSYLWK